MDSSLRVPVMYKTWCEMCWENYIAKSIPQNKNIMIDCHNKPMVRKITRRLRIRSRVESKLVLPLALELDMFRFELTPLFGLNFRELFDGFSGFFIISIAFSWILIIGQTISDTNIEHRIFGSSSVNPFKSSLVNKTNLSKHWMIDSK